MSDFKLDVDKKRKELEIKRMEIAFEEMEIQKMQLMETLKRLDDQMVFQLSEIERKKALI